MRKGRTRGSATSTAVRARAREKFIATLRATCNVSEAARTAGIDRATAYRWRDANKEFLGLWLDAEKEAADALEGEAWRRGVEGVEEPVFHQGKVCGHIRKYSDRMLEILLKGHKPKRFVEKAAVEINQSQTLRVGIDREAYRRALRDPAARLAANTLIKAMSKPEAVVVEAKVVRKRKPRKKAKAKTRARKAKA